MDFKQAQTILQTTIADFSDNTFAQQCLDVAQRVVARSKRWPELTVREFFNTEAAYETGTVAVTEDSTTITITGGTLPTTVASKKWRFALSTTDPWYEIATRSSGTVALLADDYIDATDTSSSYLVYRPHYALAPAVDRVEEVWLHRGGSAVQLRNAATDSILTNLLHYPSGPGVPTHYYCMERDSGGNKQILLGPEVPDDVYRVEYVYQKDTTDGTLGLDDARWPVVLSLAKSLAYEPKFYERAQVEMKRFQALLNAEWTRESETGSQTIQVGQGRVDYPGSNRYLDNLLAWGTVQDPT